MKNILAFLIQIKKECIHDTNEIIAYRIKFIDSYRFMRSNNLSSLVNNLSEIKDYEKCLDEKTIKGLIKEFPITYNFCKGDIHKFIMLLRKGVYPYEYVDSWEIFDETSLPYRKDFYSELVFEDISDSDYEHAKKVFKKYCKNMGDYHNLYVQTDALLLTDVYEILEISA